MGLNEDLIKGGIILIHSKVNSEEAGDIIKNLLAIQANEPTKEINLYVSSCSIDDWSILALYDVIKSLSNPISTYCIGAVGELSVILLGLANKGKRYILKNSIISFNEVKAALRPGQQTQIEIEAKHATNLKNTFETILSEQTGKDVETIHKDLMKEMTFNAEAAVEYGLIDEVLE